MMADRHSPANPPAVTASPGEWNALRLLNSYRLLVAIFLLAGFLAGPATVEFGQAMPRGFYTATAVYIVAALAFAATIRLRRPGAAVQAQVQLYTDILVLAVVAHTSGGVMSGLAVLMIVPVGGAGILLRPRHAMLFAALASLMLLGGELARSIDFGVAAAHYTQAALLGAALFVSAGLAVLSARRSATSEALAARRTQDVARLSALNERIIQQMESGILVVDPRGTIVLTNESAYQLLGNPGDLEGEALATVAPGLARALADWQQDHQAALGPVRPRSAEDGTGDITLQLQFTPLDDLGTLIAFEDAGFIEDQLQQLKLASLGRLTASIAHEVRNPLGAISHATQLLAESPRLDEQDRRFTRIVLDHCQRVNTVVENVLQLSRRRQGEPDARDLADWLLRFASDYRADRRIDAERFALTAPESGVAALFDPGHLWQVLANLCDNGFEHARPPHGEPAHVELVGGRDETGAPFIDVVDNGEPLDPELVQSLFEPFYSTRHEGTGLGLFLARELCEANHARLRYRRQAVGNCFRVTLRRAEASAGAAGA